MASVGYLLVGHYSDLPRRAIRLPRPPFWLVCRLPPPISLVPLRLAVLRAVADCGVDRRTIDLRAWLCGHGACAGGLLTILSLVPVIPVKQQ